MRLLLVSLDAVSETDAQMLLGLPALQRIARGGCFCKNVHTVYPTLTYPIHTSIVTGCYPDRHGIAHNQPFQPDTPPRMRAWYWDAGEIRAKTIYQAAKEKGLKCASVLWPVSGKSKDIRLNFPEVLPLPGENAAVKMLKYGSPAWILSTELRIGKKRKSIQQPDLDDYAELLCLDLINRRHPPEMIMLHLVDCDSMRHQYGVDSMEAYAAMKRMDAHLGNILDGMRKRGLLEDTYVCVVSDHGQRNAPKGIRLDNLLKETCGARAQTLGQGAYIYCDDIENTARVLREHAEEWGIERVLTDETLRGIHAPVNVKLAVNAAEGYCFTDSDAPTFGEHGFMNDCGEAETLFWITGKGIPQGKIIEKMDIVDIAPTLAGLLGLEMPNTDGKTLSFQ